MTQDNFFQNIESLKYLAKKEVGQNFLINQEAARRIVDSLDIKNEDKILEIGAGPGSLTYFLSQYSNEIHCIDIDEGFLLKIQNDFKDKENLHIYKGNAMDFDYSSFDKIIGNLPYYITSGIIENVLLSKSKTTKAVFMIQKEVVNRLMCVNGSEDITPFTLYLNYVCKIKRLFTVNRNSFTPAPNVDSAVIELEFDKSKQTEESLEVYKFIKAMFINKRKTVSNNLKNYLKNKENLDLYFKESGINPSARPESLKFIDFNNLYTAINKCE